MGKPPFTKALLAVFIAAACAILFASAADRSPEWAKVRKAFVKAHPVCEICGTSKDLQVHHVKPFHVDPSLELDPNNLVTVCTSKYWGFNCHLKVAHGGNFQWENPWVREDIAKMRAIASPEYIRAHGTADRDAYLKFIYDRVKAFNAKGGANGQAKAE